MSLDWTPGQAFLYVLVGGCFGLAVLFAFISSPSQRGRTRRFKGAPLMTGAEQHFYDQLRAAVPDLLIHAQVGMEALVRAVNPKDRLYIKASRLDFVVTTEKHEVVAVVELDDKTHDTARKRKSDAHRDANLLDAGYRVFRWRLKDELTLADIRKALMPPVAPAPATSPALRPRDPRA